MVTLSDSFRGGKAGGGLPGFSIERNCSPPLVTRLEYVFKAYEYVISRIGSPGRRRHLLS